MRKLKLKFIQRRYIGRKKKWLLVLVVGALGFFAWKYLRDSDRFNITSYNYNGIVKFINTEDFENVIDANIKDKNFFNFKTKDLEQTIKKNFLAAKTVKVYKKFPSSVEIQVQERVPIAIVADAEKTKFIIDEDGYVLGLVDTAYSDLTVVDYSQKLFVGQFIDTNIIPIALEILNSAKVENVKVSSMSFKPEYSQFYSGSTVVYLNNSKDIKNSLKILARLIGKTTEDGKKLSKVDLRYDKVIVSYE